MDEESGNAIRHWDFRQGFEAASIRCVRGRQQPASVLLCREIPRELLQEAEGAEVNLNMEDHRHEQFVAPARARLAFVGEGHRLGSVTPTLSRPVVPTPPREHTEKNAKEGVHLNEALPTTNIQIRLSDGSKLVAQMNHTHTVGDIRKYIVTARPEYEAATFILLTTFPHKELTDDKAMLKDANLLNAVIVQRLK